MLLLMSLIAAATAVAAVVTTTAIAAAARYVRRQPGRCSLLLARYVTRLFSFADVFLRRYAAHATDAIRHSSSGGRQRRIAEAFNRKFSHAAT